MADDARIANVERLLAADPKSIAFAQLGEWYRRAGQLDDAVRVCRAGLAHYPSHHSARITLARALLAQAHVSEARAELDKVAHEASDNVAVRGALEEWHRVVESAREGDDRRVLAELEAWLGAIHADRAARRRTDPLPSQRLI